MEAYIIEKMKVPQLRQRLVELGLETKGLKDQLIQRINEHYDTLRKKRLSKKNDNEDEESEEDESEADESDEDEDSDEDEEEESEEEEEEENFQIVSGATTSETIVENVINIIKKRGKNLNFNHIEKYENKNLAVEAVQNEADWIKGTKRETAEGIKQNYICTYHKSTECPAKCYLLYHSDSDSVSMFKSEEGHNEHIKKNQKYGISKKFKDAIDSIYDVFQKPSQIKRQLTNMFADTDKNMFPTDIQIRNYILYKKKKKGYKSRLNLAEFEKWCSEHEQIPESDDEMFVKRSFTIDKTTHKVKY